MPLLYAAALPSFVSPYPSPPLTPPSPYSTPMIRRLLLSRESSLTRESLSDAERISALSTAQSQLLNPQLSSTVNRHLAAVHNTGRRSRVLDVGTGSGAWAVALANEQPFSDVTAVDVDWSHFQRTPLRHGNVDFETVALQDMARPLPYPPNTFDVIHVANMLFDLPCYPALIERLAVILQPGGLLVVVESEPRFLSETGEMSRESRTWDACVSESYRARGIDVDLPANLASHIGASGLFMYPPTTQEAFIYAAGSSRHTLIEGIAQLASHGQLHQAVVEAGFRAMLPIVEEYGYATQELHRLLGACLSEKWGEGDAISASSQYTLTSPCIIRH